MYIQVCTHIDGVLALELYTLDEQKVHSALCAVGKHTGTRTLRGAPLHPPFRYKICQYVLYVVVYI